MTILRRVLHELVRTDEEVSSLAGRILAGELAPYSEVRILIADFAELGWDALPELRHAFGINTLTPGLYWAHGVTCRVLSTRGPAETEPPFLWGGSDPKKLEIAVSA